MRRCGPPLADPAATSRSLAGRTPWTRPLPRPRLTYPRRAVTGSVVQRPAAGAWRPESYPALEVAAQRSPWFHGRAKVTESRTLAPLARSGRGHPVSLLAHDALCRRVAIPCYCGRQEDPPAPTCRSEGRWRAPGSLAEGEHSLGERVCSGRGSAAFAEVSIGFVMISVARVTAAMRKNLMSIDTREQTRGSAIGSWFPVDARRRLCPAGL
jgi:hypothetical protein